MLAADHPAVKGRLNLIIHFTFVLHLVVKMDVLTPVVLC